MAKNDMPQADATSEAPKASRPVQFGKAKILTLQRFANRRDLLGAILEDGKSYTLAEVEAAIENFMQKGKVK